jgi:hypothetical protein
MIYQIKALLNIFNLIYNMNIKLWIFDLKSSTEIIILILRNFVCGKLYVFSTLVSIKCLKMLNENKLNFFERKTPKFGLTYMSSIPLFKRNIKMSNTALGNGPFKSNSLSKIFQIFDFTAKLWKIPDICITINSSRYQKNKYVSQAFK